MCYSELKSLIPKDKFDLTTISSLKEISEEKVQPILSELLFWVADMNWPVAREMVDVLVRFPNSIVPLIKNILKSSEKDEEWKWFIITGLIPRLSECFQKLLLEDVFRIIENPSDSELSGDVWRIAKNYMDEIGCNL